MLLYELFERELHQLEFTPHVGAKHVTVQPTPEEQELFNRAGIADTIKDLYVVHAYVEPTKGNIDIQDRLKLRAGYEGRTADVQAVIDAALDTILRRTRATGLDRKWEQTKDAVERFQNWMTSARGKFVIVPMPSSSPVTRMIAASIAQRTGAVVVDVLKKNPYPALSHQLTRNMDRKAIDYAALKAEYDAIDTAVQHAIDTDDVDAYERLVPAYEQSKTKLKTYSRKNHMLDSSSLHGVAYYNTVQAQNHQELNRLHDAYVLFVDDNIVSGHTIADAIKGLLLKGIRPKGMLGFAPHLFK